MFFQALILSIFWLFSRVTGSHFNGGTITWVPVDPYTNSTRINITITQSYRWSYPLIFCRNDTPISTPGRGSENRNLRCVSECNTDGGYSQAPIDILTDCQSSSTSLGMMKSQRSKNISLAADAHFYLSYEGSAWIGLDRPARHGLQWSIVTYIDLRKRPDGFINTPPVASVISPVYAFVNEKMQITIPVSDVNIGDDVRCRWSTYTPGNRRRRQAEQDEFHPVYQKDMDIADSIHSRVRRAVCSGGCLNGSLCNSTLCNGTTCSGLQCQDYPCCNSTETTTTTTTETTQTTTTETTTTTTTETTTTETTTTTTTETTTTTTTETTTTDTTTTTTMDTPGTLKPTSSFPNRQAVDECGDICYPGSLPNGTELSPNCTLTFTGTKANTWYGVSLQVTKSSPTPFL